MQEIFEGDCRENQEVPVTINLDPHPPKCFLFTFPAKRQSEARVCHTESNRATGVLFQLRVSEL